MGPQLKVVEKTRTATMLCAASGNPDPEISWFKDMLPVDISSSNGRIKQLRSGMLSLDLSRVSLSLQSRCSFFTKSGDTLKMKKKANSGDMRCVWGGKAAGKEKKKTPKDLCGDVWLYGFSFITTEIKVWSEACKVSGIVTKLDSSQLWKVSSCSFFDSDTWGCNSLQRWKWIIFSLLKSP